MRARLPRDPLALDPDDASWHQLHTFVVEPRTFLERLEASPLFRGAPHRGWGSAEWVRASGSVGRSAFPLGRVTVYPGGILLDAFSEARLSALLRCASALGAGRLTADETRAFRLDHVLAHPDSLLHPLSPAASSGRAVREIATTWLRMAWPFFPREDLEGRAPHVAMRTKRGSEGLDRVLTALPAELAAIPGFPRFTPLALRAIVLPEAVRDLAPRISSPRRPRPRSARRV
ncbi:MAG: hypothetical protein U0167_10950 [bacterium]